MQKKYSKLVAAGAAAVAVGVLLLPLAAEAQSDRKVQVGGKAAFNISQARGGDLVTDEGDLVVFGSGNGFSVGGLLGFDIHKNITIQPEFIYSRKKVNADVVVGGQTATGEIQTDFFEIPVVAKLHGERTSGPRPFALVGATFSFLTKAEQTLMADGVTEVGDIKDELNSSDVGLTFGGGVDLIQDWGLVTIDARYTLGLRDLSPDDGIKQDTFSFGAGIIF